MPYRSGVVSKIARLNWGATTKENPHNPIHSERERRVHWTTQSGIRPAAKRHRVRYRHDRPIQSQERPPQDKSSIFRPVHRHRPSLQKVQPKEPLTPPSPNIWAFLLSTPSSPCIERRNSFYPSTTVGFNHVRIYLNSQPNHSTEVWFLELHQCEKLVHYR